MIQFIRDPFLVLGRPAGSFLSAPLVPWPRLAFRQYCWSQLVEEGIRFHEPPLGSARSKLDFLMAKVTEREELIEHCAFKSSFGIRGVMDILRLSSTNNALALVFCVNGRADVSPCMASQVIGVR